MAKDGSVEATLVDFLQARAEEFGGRDALLFRPGFRYRRWSYADIWEGAGRIAAMLQQRGLSRGDRALIWGPNCPQWVLALFGCLRAGVIVVPIDLRSPREFVENVASRVDARLSFVSRVTPGYHRELGVPEIDFEDLEALSEDMPAPTPVDIGPDDLAEVMFTSGTTGDPKGVMLTHRNITANMASVVQVAPGKGSDRLMSILPLSHMLEQMGGLLVPMTAGANITYPAARQATVLFRTMKERRVTTMVLVPQLLDLFMKGIEREVRRQGKEVLWAKLMKVAALAPFPVRRVLFRQVHKKLGGRLSFIFAGGAPLDPDLGAKWNLLGVDVVQGYGATETSPVITCHSQDSPRYDSPGPPVPGVEVKIAGDGEVLVRGENVTQGYWNAPEATASSFEDGWYKTGDQGEFDEEGCLHLKGRKKDMIVLGSGLNVYPEDIEAMLVKHDAVEDAAVVGLPRQSGPEVHAALIVPDAARAPDAVAWANGRLAEHQRVRGFTVWPDEDFPRTHTLKVKKALLTDVLLSEDGAESDSPARQPAQEGPSLEGLIAEIAEIPVAQVADDKTLDGDLGHGLAEACRAPVRHRGGARRLPGRVSNGAGYHRRGPGNDGRRGVPDARGEEVRAVGDELVVQAAPGRHPARGHIPGSQAAVRLQGGGSFADRGPGRSGALRGKSLPAARQRPDHQGHAAASPQAPVHRGLGGAVEQPRVPHHPSAARKRLPLLEGGRGAREPGEHGPHPGRRLVSPHLPRGRADRRWPHAPLQGRHGSRRRGVGHTRRAPQARHPEDRLANRLPHVQQGRRGGALRPSHQLPARHNLRTGDRQVRGSGEGAVEWRAGLAFTILYPTFDEDCACSG